MPSARAIMMFFAPQQQSVRTSRSRPVSRRQRDSASMATSASGGRPKPLLDGAERRFLRGLLGHSAHTPRNREQNAGPSPTAVCAASKVRDSDGGMNDGEPGEKGGHRCRGSLESVSGQSRFRNALSLRRTFGVFPSTVHPQPSATGAGEISAFFNRAIPEEPRSHTRSSELRRLTRPPRFHPT